MTKRARLHEVLGEPLRGAWSLRDLRQRAPKPGQLTCPALLRVPAGIDALGAERLLADAPGPIRRSLWDQRRDRLERAEPATGLHLWILDPLRGEVDDSRACPRFARIDYEGAWKLSTQDPHGRLRVEGRPLAAGDSVKLAGGQVIAWGDSAAVFLTAYDLRQWIHATPSTEWPAHGLELREALGLARRQRLSGAGWYLVRAPRAGLADARVHQLHGDEVLVGREHDCAVVLPGGGVSRHHARLSYRAGRWWVQDLGARNGTRVDRDRVHPDHAHPLPEGATLSFGGYRAALVQRDGLRALAAPARAAPAHAA